MKWAAADTRFILSNISESEDNEEKKAEESEGKKIDKSFNHFNYSFNQQPLSILFWHHFQFGILTHMRASGPPSDFKDFDGEELLECPADARIAEYLDLRLKERLVSLYRPEYLIENF